MIKNERQYRITKTQVVAFEASVAEMDARYKDAELDLLAKVQLDAAKSQLEDLRDEVGEYEELRRNRPSSIEAKSLEDLPTALIRARIAMGMSQKELAEKMGVKEQQLQRYEATNYETANLSRLQGVASALGVRVSENALVLPLEGLSAANLYARLDQAGIDRDFLLNKLLPSEIAVGLETAPKDPDNPSVGTAAEVLMHVYGWDRSALSSSQPLQFGMEATATARFKIPAGAHGRRLGAFIAYAHYLGMVVASASKNLPRSSLTVDPKELRQALLASDPSLSLKSVLNFFWDRGVPVLPLGDAGAFHGACWRIAGRNVIVIKQRSRYLARWVFDLLHEWHHAGQSPEAEEHDWIEESEIASTRRTSPEEQAASQFAGDVVLEGHAEKLVSECVAAAKGRIPMFKSVVPTVANAAGVVVDHLANYLAWRLSLQGANWWGTANNLQTQVGDPFAIARSVFYERFDFAELNPIDAKLIHRAMQRTGDAE